MMKKLVRFAIKVKSHNSSKHLSQRSNSQALEYIPGKK